MMGIAAKIAKGRRRLESLTADFRTDDKGATAIEYGLICAMIFIVIIAAVKNVATTNSEQYQTITTAIDDATE